MANWPDASAALIGAYVLGCFASGYYLVRAIKHLDIRTVGSGSVGARNVSRVLGKTGFLLTALGDAGKGALSILAARRIFQDEDITAVALVAVTAGHIWPVQLRFRGGKGVATSLGALCIYDWRLAAAYLVFFAMGLASARKIVLPALLAFVGLPVTAAWLSHDWYQISAQILLAVMIVFAHRENLVEEVKS